MDSSLTLASFSQRYLVKAQDIINVLLEQIKIITLRVYNNQKMNVFVFICIRVEYLGIFCSVLFGFKKFNKINYIAILSGYLESVLQVPQKHTFSIFEP